jgi:predicted RNA-binding Zn ribbon-like protein
MVSQPRLHNPCGAHLALDFVNSIGRTPGRRVNERLVDYAALLRWSSEAESLTPARARRLGRVAGDKPAVAAKALERALALREAIFEVFSADAHGKAPPPAELARLNSELESALAHARVERSAAGFAWAWAFDDEPDAPLWPIARAAAELLVSPERRLVRECASETCLWLFVDRTRNHGRRWCEMKGCGNLSKVRRHRKRRRASEG